MEAGELLARLEACVGSLEKIGADHETRIRSLEKSKWKMAGALGLACFVVPFVFQFLAR